MFALLNLIKTRSLHDNAALSHLGDHEFYAYVVSAFSYSWERHLTAIFLSLNAVIVVQMRCITGVAHSEARLNTSNFAVAVKAVSHIKAPFWKIWSMNKTFFRLSSYMNQSCKSEGHDNGVIICCVGLLRAYFFTMEWRTAIVKVGTNIVLHPFDDSVQSNPLAHEWMVVVTAVPRLHLHAAISATRNKTSCQYFEGFWDEDILLDTKCEDSIAVLFAE